MATLTYTEVGATAGELPARYHHVRMTRVIGHGRERFERASDDLFAGLVQRRAGARIRLSDVPLREGTRVRMLVSVGPLAFRIPASSSGRNAPRPRPASRTAPSPGTPSAGRSASRCASHPPVR